MKTDLIAALDVAATLLDAAVWAWIVSAWLLTIGAALIPLFAGRIAGDYLAERIHTRRDLRQLEQYANQPRPHIPAQTRKEQP